MNKKGALELSINAIVILILAITMLGLGLGFMKKTFGGVTSQFGEVSDQIKKEMIDRIKDSTSKVMLNVYEIEMKRSEEKSIFLAIKNDLQDDTLVEFSIAIKTDDCKTIAGTACEGDVTVSTFSTKKVQPGEVEVIPMKVKVSSGAEPTTYLIPIEVTPPGAGSQPQTVDLYVTVK
ncbi:hypothetical protein HYU07_02955 [Candidatus Woesearchaeota archaeon]|nr:hypothetical protein [Candidatus Woesearchaeota archaeon]